MDLILMIVAFGAIMYFLMIRPQQKRAKEHQALLNSLEAGARVLLTSGMFATLRHVGERQMIVELAPGTEITVLKGNIARVVTPEEEEFEFSDDADSDEAVEAEETGAYDGLADGLEPSHFTEDAAPEFDPRPETAADDVAESDADVENPKNEN